jgi:hypothetical protein
MNRFYRPSAPTYTSQFVEQQLPTDLIMKSGMMKAEKKQAMAQAVGETSAMNAALTPGYRTARMAPKVIDDWETKINNTIAELGSDYDTPQAVMALSKLRNEWQRDPNVQLIKYDRTLGNEEWDTMRKSPTFAQDEKGNNVSLKTGQLKQFNPGDQYKPYDPVTRYADIGDEARQEIGSVAITERPTRIQIEPYLNAKGEVIGTQRTQGSISGKDQEAVKGKLLVVMNNVLGKKTAAGAYEYERLKRQLGRPPTAEDVLPTLLPYAQEAIPTRIKENTSWDTSAGASNSSSKGALTIPSGIRIPPRQSNIPGNADYRYGLFRPMKSVTELNKNAKILHNTNLKNDPNYAGMDFKSQVKYMKDQTINTGYPIETSFDYHGPETEQMMNKTILGSENAEGRIKEVGSTLLQNFVIYDTETGKEIQNVKDKQGIVKKGNMVRWIGPSTIEDKAYNYMPGATYMKVEDGNKSHLYAIKIPDLEKEEKGTWNLEGWKRNPLTGVGDVFAIDYHGANQALTFSDVSDSNTDGVEEKVSTKTSNGLYMVPYFDKDKGVMYNAFSSNPSLQNNDPRDTNTPGFLGSYSLNEYAEKDRKTDPMIRIMKDIVNTHIVPRLKN